MLDLLAIAALVLLLQIPIGMIRSLISERTSTRNQAVAEVAQTWGGRQVLAGPRLVVPYRSPEGTDPATAVRSVSFLPDRLEVDGHLQSESLHKGLFTVPVYRSRLTLAGAFSPLSVQDLGLDPERILWEGASLVVEISDPRAVGAGARVVWDGAEGAFDPGTVGSLGRAGIHAPVTLDPTRPNEFQIVLELRGSEEMGFAPFARETRTSLTSDWPSPGYEGAWLPVERSLGPEGSTARWVIPFLGRDYPQAWRELAAPRDQIEESIYRMRLVPVVDHYRMAERSTKYASLFLLLTFGLLWLFDAMAGVRVHPVQYLLVGSAMCLFYLLELALSEHVGFLPAYGMAGGGVVLLVAGYSRAILRSTLRGTVVGGALGGLYAYLLALLSLEEYALLAGALGLFVMLGLVMYLTRWIDWGWSRPTGPQAPAA